MVATCSAPAWRSFVRTSLRSGAARGLTAAMPPPTIRGYWWVSEIQLTFLEFASSGPAVEWKSGPASPSIGTRPSRKAPHDERTDGRSRRRVVRGRADWRLYVARREDRRLARRVCADRGRASSAAADLDARLVANRRLTARADSWPLFLVDGHAGKCGRDDGQARGRLWRTGQAPDG